MKTINLLPKEVRVKDIKSVILNAVSILLIVVVVILVGISVFMFNINKDLEPKLNDYKNINMNIDNYIIKLEEYEKLKKKVDDKSELIKLLKKDEILWSEILYDFGEKMPDNAYIGDIKGDSELFYKFNTKSAQEKQEADKILCFTIDGFAATHTDINKLMIEIRNIPNIGEVWPDNISKIQVVGIDAWLFRISAYYDLNPYLEEAAAAESAAPEEKSPDAELESMVE